MLLGYGILCDDLLNTNEKPEVTIVTPAVTRYGAGVAVAWVEPSTTQSHKIYVAVVPITGTVIQDYKRYEVVSYANDPVGAVGLWSPDGNELFLACVDRMGLSVRSTTNLATWQKVYDNDRVVWNGMGTIGLCTAENLLYVMNGPRSLLVLRRAAGDTWQIYGSDTIRPGVGVPNGAAVSLAALDPPAGGSRWAAAYPSVPNGGTGGIGIQVHPSVTPSALWLPDAATAAVGAATWYSQKLNLRQLACAFWSPANGLMVKWTSDFATWSSSFGMKIDDGNKRGVQMVSLPMTSGGHLCIVYATADDNIRVVVFGQP